MKIIAVLLGCSMVFTSNVLRAEESEVRDPTHTQVVVREHPKTGKPYVSITPEGPVPKDPFTGQRRGYKLRPDYRLLDPKVKSGEVPYEGPVSDHTRIYIFAATLMTVGAVGGAMGMAAVPAASGTAAAGGGAGYAVAGSLLAGGATAAGVLSNRARPEDENFKHVSESELREIKKDKEPEPLEQRDEK